MTVSMQSDRLQFESLTPDHADALYSVLTDAAVLEFIDPTNLQTQAEFRSEYACRAAGPQPPNSFTEQWFNMAVTLKAQPSLVIGRLEATSYGDWGEIAYVFGKDWWGKSLAFEAMCWWHDHLTAASSATQWWATVHPDNARSIRLLHRLGYQEKIGLAEYPNLQSYDPGDRCFLRDCSSFVSR